MANILIVVAAVTSSFKNGPGCWIIHKFKVTTSASYVGSTSLRRFSSLTSPWHVPVPLGDTFATNSSSSPQPATPKWWHNSWKVQPLNHCLQQKPTDVCREQDTGKNLYLWKNLHRKNTEVQKKGLFRQKFYWRTKAILKHDFKRAKHAFHKNTPTFRLKTKDIGKLLGKTVLLRNELL